MQFPVSLCCTRVGCGEHHQAGDSIRLDALMLEGGGSASVKAYFQFPSIPPARFPWSSGRLKEWD